MQLQFSRRFFFPALISFRIFINGHDVFSYALFCSFLFMDSRSQSSVPHSNWISQFVNFLNLNSFNSRFACSQSKPINPTHSESFIRTSDFATKNEISFGYNCFFAFFVIFFLLRFVIFIVVVVVVIIIRVRKLRLFD